VAGTAVCDDGIVIDLSAMRGMRVLKSVGSICTHPASLIQPLSAFFAE
jgi:hypothetical protein